VSTLPKLKSSKKSKVVFPFDALVADGLPKYIYTVAPAAGIDGTFTQRLALELPGFQLSIQYGSRVTPSLAVNRMSPPFDCALVKSNPGPNTTFNW
jgi:hypothetical protein